MAEVPARRDVVAAVRFLERHPCVCNLRIGLRQYPRCFAGVDAAHAMVTGGLCGRVNDGVALLGAAVEGGLIFHAAGTNSCRAWDSVYSFVRHEVPLRTEGDGLHALASFIHDHVPICDRAYRLRLYKNCFVGQHVVDALLEHNMAASRADAVAMCQPLVGPFFQHVVGDHAFKDEWLYYIFHVDRDDPVWSIDLRQRWRPTWRFPPHVRCNSLFLTPAIADAVEEAIGRGDAAAARDALRDVRQRVLSQAFAPQRDRGNPDGWEHVRTTRRGDAPAMWMYRKTAEGKFRTSKTVGLISCSPNEFASSFVDFERRSEWETLFARGVVLEDTGRRLSRRDAKRRRKEGEAVRGHAHGGSSPGVGHLGSPGGMERVMDLVGAGPDLHPAGTAAEAAVVAQEAGDDSDGASGPGAAAAQAGEGQPGSPHNAGAAAEGGHASGGDLEEKGTPQQQEEEEEEEEEEPLVYEQVARFFRRRLQSNEPRRHKAVRSKEFITGTGGALMGARRYSAASTVPGRSGRALQMPSLPEVGPERENSVAGAGAAEEAGDLVDLGGAGGGGAVRAAMSPAAGSVLSAGDAEPGTGEGRPMERSSSVKSAEACMETLGAALDGRGSRGSGREGEEDRDHWDATLPGFDRAAFPRVTYRAMRPASALARPRDVCVLQDVFRDAESGVTAVYEISVDYFRLPEQPGLVRAEILAQAHIAEPFGSKGESTRLTVVSQSDPRGSLPPWAENAIGDVDATQLVAAPAGEALTEAGAAVGSQDGAVLVAGPAVTGSEGEGEEGEVQAITAAAEGTVSLRDFELLAVLGRGGYGKVMQVRHTRSGRVYAMKVLRKLDLVRRKQVERTLVERLVLEQARKHPFVIGLHYAFQSPDKLYMVMDLAQGGDFFTHLSRDGCFDEARARFYVAEIVLAFEHLHSMGVVYRDLKPENVLLDAEGHVRLTDFGLSRYFEHRPAQHFDPRLVGDGNEQPGQAAFVTHSFCGTEQYMAPEMLLQRGHGQGMDWWSLGVLLCEMVTGKHPFRGASHFATLRNIVSASAPRLQGLSAPARSLCAQLLVKDPERRLGARGGAAEVKEHPFFFGIDWNALLRRRVEAPYRPALRAATDTTHFDNLFTREAPLDSVAEGDATQGDHGGGFALFNFFGRGKRRKKQDPSPSALEQEQRKQQQEGNLAQEEDLRLFKGFAFAADEEGEGTSSSSPEGDGLP